MFESENADLFGKMDDASIQPRLAIIISCFNYANFVEQAIRSVTDQERQDCELVVIDDGSTDDSWEVIGRTGVAAFRIDNSGQLAACRYGVSKTKAPFILFLDADDTLKPGSLDNIIKRLDPDVAKLQFSLTQIGADGNAIAGATSSLESFRSRDALVRRVLRTGVYKTPPTSGNVFRRDVCQLLYEVEYDRAVDGVILFAAPFFGDIVSVSEDLGCYRIHDRNDSGLGKLPDALSLARDIQRFEARLNHLRAIVHKMEPTRQLVDAHATFYFQDRSFYLDIASGLRPRLIKLPALLWTLLDVPYSAKKKLGMAAFFLLATILSNKRSKALLAYRLRPGHRSALGFAKVIFAR